MCAIINKFNKEEIFLLYDYLVAYEESGIGRYSTTKSLLKDHPELKGLETEVKSVVFHSAKPYEMKDMDFKLMENEIYITKCSGNLMLSFLAHLRNSIGHGNAVKHQDKVLITDFAHPRYNPIDFTARGCIYFNVIKNLTKVLKEIVL